MDEKTVTNNYGAFMEYGELVTSSLRQIWPSSHVYPLASIANFVKRRLSDRRPASCQQLDTVGGKTRFKDMLYYLYCSF